MKLLQIICIAEYKKEVMNILKHAGVKAFSFHPIQGFKNEDQESHSWFVATGIATDSLQFSVYIQDTCEVELFKRIAEFNKKSPSKSKIHTACIQVENANF